MALIELTKLSRSFGGIRAVDHVDIEMNPGEIVGLVGPNGSGKTTIFNLITGFLRPDHGTIRFKGDNITGLRPDQIAKKGVGRTFQLTLLFHGQTVLESLLAGHVRVERTGFWRALFNTNAYQEDQKQAEEDYVKQVDEQVEMKLYPLRKEIRTLRKENEELKLKLAQKSC